MSDLAGMATRMDPSLVNPWGMTLGLNSGLWISDNGSGVATSYDGNGQPLPVGSPLVVTIPAPGGGMSAPTGVATNDTNGFMIASGANSAPFGHRTVPRATSARAKYSGSRAASNAVPVTLGSRRKPLRSASPVELSTKITFRRISAIAMTEATRHGATCRRAETTPAVDRLRGL